MRAYLGGNNDSEWELESFFYNEQRLRPALRTLLHDAEFAETAIKTLAFFGDPEDLRLIFRAKPPVGKDNRWAYGVACALVEPRTESEWEFLRRAALNEYDDLWVDAGAIESLKVIASPRSRRVLEGVRGRNRERAKLATRAIEYIDSKPAPLVDRDLERLAERVANAIRYGELGWIGAPLFNRERDKALVEFSYFGGGDRFTYHATFHKVQGTWRFRGAQETAQGVLAPPPPSRVDLERVPVRKAPLLPIK